MDLRNIRDTYGLTATGLASRTGAAGEVNLGSSGTNDYGSSSSLNLGSLLISGITNTASPVLNLVTMMVTENGATSVDEGVTFEGKPLNLAFIRAIMIERLDGLNTAIITVTGNDGSVWKLPAQSYIKMGNSPAQLFAAFQATQITFTSNAASTTSALRVTFLAS